MKKTLSEGQSAGTLDMAPKIMETKGGYIDHVSCLA